MIKTHIIDGVALTKFIYWLKNKTKFYINVQNIHRNSLQELNLGKKLSASFDINDLIILEK